LTDLRKIWYSDAYLPPNVHNQIVSTVILWYTSTHVHISRHGFYSCIQA